MELAGKTAIITGASSGIGEATAKKLAENGINVVLAARRMERLVALKDEIEREGGSAIEVKTDVTDRASVERMVDFALSKYGSIDIVVNNAGIMPLSMVNSLHVDEWDRMIDVNIKGPLYVTAAVLPLFREQKSGHFINVSSVAGRRVFAGGSVYCASKYAIRAFSEGLRLELTPSEKIRVTVIEPGATNTELFEGITDQTVKSFQQSRLAKMTRLEAVDIAEAIWYALNQPPHVNVNEILVLPTDQV